MKEGWRRGSGHPVGHTAGGGGRRSARCGIAGARAKGESGRGGHVWAAHERVGQLGEGAGSGLREQCRF
jgi:hypothetical protein